MEKTPKHFNFLQLLFPPPGAPSYAVDKRNPSPSQTIHFLLLLLDEKHASQQGRKLHPTNDRPQTRTEKKSSTESILVPLFILLLPSWTKSGGLRDGRAPIRCFETLFPDFPAFPELERYKTNTPAVTMTTRKTEKKKLDVAKCVNTFFL